jgi:hypothetical protein
VAARLRGLRCRSGRSRSAGAAPVTHEFGFAREHGLACAMSARRANSASLMKHPG